MSRYGVVLGDGEAATILLSIMDGTYISGSRDDEDYHRPLFSREQLTALGMGVQALLDKVSDKNHVTAKKVIIMRSDFDYNKGGFYREGICPTCGQNIASYMHGNYCPKCGQLLDWDNGVKLEDACDEV